MQRLPDFKNRIASLYFHKEENYMEIVYKGVYLDDLEALQDLFDHGIILQEGKIYPCLSNGLLVKGASKDYRKLSEIESPKLVSALALLVGNPLARIAGNLFIKFAKLSYPAKLFSDKEKALKWLQEQT